jgi:hypothetical protein
MSDLETRLTEALRAESEDAPGARDLAGAARARARTRRRTRVAAAAGAVAIAALAVPVAIVVSGSDDEVKLPAADETASDLEPVDTGRWESWHGVTVRVPEDWEYGDQSAWCADGGSVEAFRVSRPGGVVPSIACTPGSSYGLAFQEIEMDEAEEPFDWPVVTQTGDAWPPGTFVGAHGEDGVLITVAGPDREDLLEILATVRAVEDVDPHGCSVTDDGGPGMAGAGEVPVCRYDEAGQLVQSERLTGDDAAAAVTAVRGTRRQDGGNLCDNDESAYVVMGVEGDRVEVQYAGELDCADQGVFIEGVRHELTEGVLHWALSPGWTGSVRQGVPLPPELRQR